MNSKNDHDNVNSNDNGSDNDNDNDNSNDNDYSNDNDNEIDNDDDYSNDNGNDNDNGNGNDDNNDYINENGSSSDNDYSNDSDNDNDDNSKNIFLFFLFFYLRFNLDQYASTGMVVTLPKTPKQVKVDVNCSFLYFLWFSGNFILIWFEEPNRYKNSEEVLVDYEISHFLTT